MKPNGENYRWVAQNRSAGRNKRSASAISIFLNPGIGLKRWVVIVVLGISLLALGLGFILPFSLSPSFMTGARYATLVWLPVPLRGLIFSILGIVLMTFGIRHLYRMVSEGVFQGQSTGILLKNLHEYRTRLRGPRVVAIGGGTGMATLLRGLKTGTNHITAVVTVADDGGSSGRLREELGIPPPGDARNCLVALSETEPLLERLMEYRFKNGESLQGHNMGNLLLAALAELEGGFGEGLDSAAKLLGVNGRVVPSTLAHNVVLSAIDEEGHITQGESQLSATHGQLTRVWLEPEGLEVNPEVSTAVSEADVIIIGPGSLYTSLIPNLLVRGFSEAFEGSRARKIFVCNVATQSGETDNYGVTEHLKALYDHSELSFTHLITNSNWSELPKNWGQEAVQPKCPDWFKGHFMAVDVVDESLPTKHDSLKLATVIFDIAASKD